MRRQKKLFYPPGKDRYWHPCVLLYCLVRDDDSNTLLFAVDVVRWGYFDVSEHGESPFSRGKIKCFYHGGHEEHKGRAKKVFFVILCALCGEELKIRIKELISYFFCADALAFSDTFFAITSAIGTGPVIGALAAAIATSKISGIIIAIF